MDERSAFRPFEAHKAVAIRWAYATNGALYPIWHLLAPEPAIDPYAAWWIVGAWLVGTAALAQLLPRLRPWQDALLLVGSYAATAHLFALATFNGLHPFFRSAP